MISQLADGRETTWEDHIKIMAVSWNMGGESPDLDSIERLFQKDVVCHDMYVFGS